MAEQETTHRGRKGSQRMGRQGVAGVADERERPGSITYEQFLDLVEEGTRAEWVDGAIEVSSPARLDHQDLDRFLVTTLSLFVAAHDLGTILGPICKLA